MKIQEKCPECGSDDILIDGDESVWYCAVCGFETYDFRINDYKVKYGKVVFENGKPVFY